MDSAYISPKKISAVHPGEVRGARSGSIASSPFATLKNEDQPPPSRETRSAESIQDSGPQHRRSVFSRPSRGDTWQQVEPSRLAQLQRPLFSESHLAGKVRTVLAASRAISTPRSSHSNAQKTAPSYPETRSSESIQDLGPTATSDEFRTVRFEGRMAPD
jgi:hypothetical protein